METNLVEVIGRKSPTLQNHCICRPILKFFIFLHKASLVHVFHFLSSFVVLIRAHFPWFFAFFFLTFWPYKIIVQHCIVVLHQTTMNNRIFDIFKKPLTPLSPSINSQCKENQPRTPPKKGISITRLSVTENIWLFKLPGLMWLFRLQRSIWRTLQETCNPERWNSV